MAALPCAALSHRARGPNRQERTAHTCLFYVPPRGSTHRQVQPCGLPRRPATPAPAVGLTQSLRAVRKITATVRSGEGRRRQTGRDHWAALRSSKMSARLRADCRARSSVRADRDASQIHPALSGIGSWPHDIPHLPATFQRRLSCTPCASLARRGGRGARLPIQPPVSRRAAIPQQALSVL